jgi:four helix bundle protein
MEREKEKPRMTAAKTYEDLQVWRKAHGLVLKVYHESRRFPREELYGLTSQLRRSIASVAANIVEGFRRPTKADKTRFYQIALSSLDESHYHLRLAHDLGYADTIALRVSVDEIGRMLNAYTQSIIDSDRIRRSIKHFGILFLATGILSSFFSLLTSRF